MAIKNYYIWNTINKLNNPIMKTLIALAVIIPLSLIGMSNAQEVVRVEQSVLNLTEGTIPAFKVKIYQANMEDVIKKWGKLVVSETDKKSRKKPVVSKNDYAIDSVRLTQITDKPLNVKSIFIQNDWGVEMVTAIKLDGSFLDSTNQLVYQRASRFIRDFALSEYYEAVEVELSDEERELKALEDGLDQLTHENMGLRKDISSYQQDTVDAKEEIAIQKANREMKNKQILEQESIISRVRGDKLLVKEQKQILQELKRDRQKISNRISREERSIITANSRINKAIRAISMNEQEQEKQQELIRMQMEHIDSVRLKLGAIK